VIWVLGYVITPHHGQTNKTSPCPQGRDRAEQPAAPGPTQRMADRPGEAVRAKDQPVLTLKQLEAAIRWPLPGESQAWEREMTCLERPGMCKHCLLPSPKISKPVMQQAESELYSVFQCIGVSAPASVYVVCQTERCPTPPIPHYRRPFQAHNSGDFEAVLESLTLGSLDRQQKYHCQCTAAAEAPPYRPHLRRVCTSCQGDFLSSSSSTDRAF